MPFSLDTFGGVGVLLWNSFSNHVIVYGFLFKTFKWITSKVIKTFKFVHTKLFKRVDGSENLINLA